MKIVLDGLSANRSTVFERHITKVLLLKYQRVYEACKDGFTYTFKDLDPLDASDLMKYIIATFDVTDYVKVVML